MRTLVLNDKLQMYSNVKTVQAACDRYDSCWYRGRYKARLSQLTDPYSMLDVLDLGSRWTRGGGRGADGIFGGCPDQT